MASEFSDPAWWPTPPPKPPSTVSVTKVIFGTLIPVAVAVVIAVLFLTQKDHHSAADTHSYAAFQACFEAQGGDTQAARTNTRLLEEAAQACRDHLPPGTSLPSFTVTAGQERAQQAFQKCMEAATANLHHGFSRFGGSSNREAFEKAIALCQAISIPSRPRHKAPAAPT
jgi:hypothetical protein